MNARREVLAGGAVALGGGRVVELGSSAELLARHPTAETLDARGCIVAPGLVNTHQHLTGDPLVQGCIPDTIDTDTSIYGWAVPIHAAHEPVDDEIAAALEALRCLRAGTTTIVEAGTVAHPDRVAVGIDSVGARATLGQWGWDVEGVPFGGTVDEVLDRQRELVGRHPAGRRVEGWVTLVGHSMASDELLVGASGLARELGVGMTMHLSPTSSDPDDYLERTGRRPVEHLAELGVLGPHLLLAHAVWLDDREVELVLEHDVAIAYCPWAYLRLGQGVTVAGRHAEIVEAGGRIGLGCDAANAADHHDIRRTAALAAGLARDMRLRPDRFGAHDAFALATIGGAAAMGAADRIGSLEPGKQADLVVFEPDGLEHRPEGDPVLALVWGTTRARDVVVAGEVVVRGGRSTMVDEEALVAEAVERRRHLLARAGITPRSAWPVIEAG